MTPLPISILGSTGSIGRSTLKVVDRYPKRLRVVALAGGSNVEAIVSQTLKYNPELVAMADMGAEDLLRSKLSGFKGTIIVGPDSLKAAATWPSAQTVVVGVVGFVGVEPTLAAIEAGKNIALANKETLVTAGTIVMARADKRGVSIAPIDSEHSALWQCLRAGERRDVRRLILTASGGPFRDRPVSSFSSITPAEALAHPTWKMGPRITIDSATMMNKGFEIIEAARLFGFAAEDIDVVIHPQSVIHSMVEFQDGSIVAQLGPTDMTHPIAYALFAPERLPVAPDAPTLDFARIASLEFAQPDPDRYPALGLAQRALATGETAPTVLNAADEVAVEAFLASRIQFPEIVSLVNEALTEHIVASGADIGDIVDADRWARGFVKKRVADAVTQRESAPQR
jgi:1-deoxy-D-xylulose-5-phosphate reductoisomerase